MNDQRDELIKEIIAEGALKTKEIIEAFRTVPREHFVLPQYMSRAYANYPLPIHEGQTISQPLTVAVLTEAAAPRRGNNVLEVGAGSGYQAAILAEIVGPDGHVTAIERLSKLVEFAKKNLKLYKNVTVVKGDGTTGCEKNAPYDCIVVSASAKRVPQALIAQLKDGGRLVVPVGTDLTLIEKRHNKTKETFLGYFSFVPLIED